MTIPDPIVIGVYGRCHRICDRGVTANGGAQSRLFLLTIIYVYFDVLKMVDMIGWQSVLFLHSLLSTAGLVMETSPNQQEF